MFFVESPSKRNTDICSLLNSCVNFHKPQVLWLHQFANGDLSPVSAHERWICRVPHRGIVNQPLDGSLCQGGLTPRPRRLWHPTETLSKTLSMRGRCRHVRETKGMLARMRRRTRLEAGPWRRGCCGLARETLPRHDRERFEVGYGSITNRNVGQADFDSSWETERAIMDGN